MAGRIVGVPAIRSTDVGPIIEAEARENIAAYVAEARAAGRVIAEAQRTDLPSDGHFVPPALIRLDHVTDLKREIFGPVLHVATWKGGELDALIDAINARSEEHTSELQSLMRISYAVFCLKQKKS